MIKFIMLICSKCKKYKEDDCFRWQNQEKAIRSFWCKDCFKEHEKSAYLKRSPEKKKHLRENEIKRIVENKQYVWDYLKSHPCGCGEDDPVLLEFDHSDPKEKTASIADLQRTSYGLKRIKEEISKCIVLCVACHRRKTALQFGWYKDIQR